MTQRTLRWRDDAPWWLDVAAFEDALDRADREGQAVGALQEAVELYGGDLLQSSYDEWLLEERLRRRYLEPWSGWPSCWRPGASMPGQSGTPSDFCAKTRCGRRPTGS